MRILPILTAIFVAAVIFILIFQRDLVADFLSSDAEPTETSTPVDAAAVEEIDGPTRVAIVAQKSTARQLDSAVIVRGQTEAARQVRLLAETSGTVVSQPLRRGTFVEENQTMCVLDPGTRAASLAEARARLAEAEARVPEAKARVTEAEARLDEARINDRAASRLSQDGFASETRVAAAAAALSSASAGVEAAKSGLQSTIAGIQSAEASVAAAEKEIERLTISASFNGILETDTAELGSLLQPGAMCATVIQLDPIKLVGFVPEVDVDRVTLDAPTSARLINGSTVTGLVTFVSRSSDPTTRTFRVEVEIPNPDLKIRDGQTVDMLIQSEGTMAHLLPGSALTLDNAGNLGFRIVDTDQNAKFVPVTLVRDTIDGVWVTGLDDTADVIVVGQEFVSDGVPVDVTYR
ncbi:MAG: efflux RND transporter periplasmic adaptor subunit [Planktomarina sp.]